MSSNEGGHQTTRMSYAEEARLHREQQQADARRYLLDRDLGDVAEILGLVEPATPPARVRSRVGGDR